MSLSTHSSSAPWSWTSESDFEKRSRPDACLDSKRSEWFVGSADVKNGCHVEFQGAPEDCQNQFVASADVKNAFHQMRIPGWLHTFFALPAVLASEVGHTGKNVDQKRLVPDSLMYLVRYDTPDGFSWEMFFCQDVTDHCTVTRSADFPLSFGRDTAARLQTWHGSVLTTLGFWLVALSALTFILHVLLQVQKAALDVHNISLASGSEDVLGYEVSPSNAYRSGTGKRISRIRSVARMISSRRRNGGRAMVTSLSWRTAIVELSQFLTHASSSRAS